MSTNMTTRCTTCGHGPENHQDLFPQCSAARCTCLKYRQAEATATPTLASVPAPTTKPAVPPAPSIDELIRACARSDFKRTQALGVKLAQVAEKARAALRAERETAEVKAKRERERTAAVAEIKRLEKALAEARAKATAAGRPGGTRGGERICEECGRQLANGQALGAHKRHTHGIRSSSPKTRSASA